MECAEVVSVCRNGKSTAKQFSPSKQWHRANQTLSEAELNCRLVFIFGAAKSSKKYVCVLGDVRVWGVVWLGGWSVVRSVCERGVLGLLGSCTWAASLQLGEREASGGGEVKG